MRKRMLVGILVGLLAAAAAPARADVVLFADGFELDPVSGSGGTTALVAWQVTGNVDVVGTAGKCAAAGGTTQCLDLEGTGSGAPPVIVARSALTLYPGEYQLSFDLAGSQGGDGENSVTVSLGTLYEDTFTRNGSEPFARVDVPITVPDRTVATLAFAHAGSRDANGVLLDNVQLVLLQTNPLVSPGGFAKAVAVCQQTIGQQVRTLVQKVLNRHALCLKDEARGKPCDEARRDERIAEDALKARAGLDKACTTAEYTALGHVGDAGLTRERIVLMALDAAIALVRAGYVADYPSLP